MGTILTEMPGSKGRSYNIIRGNDGVVYCECVAWKMSPKPKTCKHLERFFAEFGGNPPQQPVPVGTPSECVSAEKTGSGCASEVFEAIEQERGSIQMWEHSLSSNEKPLDIQVQRMYRFETDRPLKAFADIIVNDALLIKGVRVMDGKQGLFVSMPREQAKDGERYDTIRCLTPEVRDQITEVILKAYNEE